MNFKLVLGFGFATALAAATPAAFAQHYDNTVECSSTDYHFERCGVNWNDARLVRQTSDARCTRGQSWGVDRKGLWVDKGCAGVFRDASGSAGRYHHDEGHYAGGERYEGGGGGWRPGPGWDSEFVVHCASQDYAYNFCGVDLGGGGRARLANQISKTACIEGRTWGWNRAGVWVEGGCEGDFRITRRWH